MSSNQSKNPIDWQRRAEAAEKTLTILKAKVIELYNQGAQSVIHKQLEKAKQREEENRRKQEIFQVRNQELQNYNEALEEKVRERTEEVKVILDHVHFGFMTVDRKLTIHGGYTASCYELFGTENLSGKNFLDLFEINQRRREHYLLCIDQIFEDIMPESVSISQLPSRFTLGERVIQVEASVIRVEGKVSRLLFSACDITQLEAAQREAAIHKTLVGVLKQRESFQEFVGELREQFRLAKSLADVNEQRSLRRIVHTMKGNLGSWSLVDIANRLHEIEDESAISRERIDEIENAVRKFLSDHSAVIGIEYDGNGEANFEISPREFSKLKNIVDSLQQEEAQKLRTWTAEVLQKPVSVLLGPIDDFMNKLAIRLGKEVDFFCQGDDLQVDVETMRPVLQNIIHVLRNSVDHGIEDIHGRGSKPKKGHVELTFERDGDQYIIEVRDDGRGIDTDKLIQKAIGMNLISEMEVSHMSEKEIYDLIFLDGLSSAEQTTDISGRGVGMSAVRDAIRKANGEIQINSQAGKGTSFRFIIPVPDILRAKSVRVA